ncbi:MAG: hypothetical protein ACXVIY_05435 [Mucilaginibacter sp.]
MKRLTLALICILFAIVAAGQSKKKTTDTAKNTPAPSTTSFRMLFDDIFKRNADNTVSPRLPLEINGEMVGTSTKIVGGAKYGGIDISYYTGHDALVDTLKGVVIIRQFLK